MSSTHHHHHSAETAEPINHLALAFSATVHCLIGCGIGEVVGMIVSAFLGLDNITSIIVAILLGFVFGLVLGIRPWLKAGYRLSSALVQVLIAEGLSIAVMEAAEAVVEINTPGVMAAHPTEGIFWLGMLLALIAGFAAAFPVNLLLVKRGVRHKH
jgi:hypothetical protein